MLVWLASSATPAAEILTFGTAPRPLLVPPERKGTGSSVGLYNVTPTIITQPVPLASYALATRKFTPLYGAGINRFTDENRSIH